MIRSFSCKQTLRIWEGDVSLKLPSQSQTRALRKLRQLDAAQSIDDLIKPPSNHLEKLYGERTGQMSIRMNKKW